MSKQIAENYYPGELVIMGFAGPTLPSETIRNIQNEHITQIILFAQNYESPAQLITLTDHIQNITYSESTPLPKVISADQEGGRVQRFINGFTRLPSAKNIGIKNSPNLAFEIARIQAKELFSAGIQLNYAPVADINTNPQNPVIGERAFGDQEERVSKMVTAVVRGHLQEGVQPCVKHFPGHGDTHVDTHFALATVNTPLELLRTREWIPFHKAMKSGCNFLMSAHVLLPHLDPNYPGTFSKTFLQTYLRKELSFDGVVVSDDMQMEAVTKNFGADEAPLLALEAGCDVLCYRHEPQALLAIESIKKAIADGRLNRDRLKASIDRVRKIRASLTLAQTSMSNNDRLSIIGHPEHQEFVAQQLT